MGVCNIKEILNKYLFLKGWITKGNPIMLNQIRNELEDTEAFYDFSNCMLSYKK